MYSDRLLDHFQNPRNVGELSPPAIIVEVMNPACGDILRLSALLENGIVRKAAFKVRGCTAAVAAASALTELMSGKEIPELGRVTAAQIEEAVGGLQPESKHAAILCLDGLGALLNKR